MRIENLERFIRNERDYKVVGVPGEVGFHVSESSLRLSMEPDKAAHTIAPLFRLYSPVEQSLQR